MEIKTKNSAVDLTDLAVGILVLGIAVTIGSSILINIRDSRITELDAGVVVNETVSAVSDSGTDLSVVWVNDVNTCINATGKEIINSANYTTTVNPNFGTGTVSYTGPVGGQYNTTDWECSYSTYNTSDPQYSLPNDAATGLAEYGNWFDIIVIVGVAAVILSLIFMAFGRRGGTANY